MSRITTHVLDTVLGKPASGIRIRLDRFDCNRWSTLSEGATDTDGRCRELTEVAGPGICRLTFETGSYLERAGRKSIYPEISVTFTCAGELHYHLPLLLSDNSYTTYRGS